MVKSLACVLVLNGLALTGTSHAHTWRTVTGPNWSDAANWGGTLPTNNGTADLTFSIVDNPALPHGDTLLDQDWNVRSIMWNSDALDSGTASIRTPISTTTLQLQSGLNNASGGLVLLQPNVSVPTAQTWDTSLGSTVVVAGLLSGSGQINKAGSGTLSLQSSSAGFTGSIKIGGGTVRFSQDNPISNGAFVFNTGSVIGEGGPRTIDSPVAILNPNQNSTFFFSGSNALTFTGPINLSGANARLGGSATSRTVFAGPISNGSLTLFNGTWRLAETNTVSGAVTVSSGAVLEVTGSATLPATAKLTLSFGSLAATTTSTITRQVEILGTPGTGGGGTINTGTHTLSLSGSVTGNGGLTKTGAGALVLSNTTSAPIVSTTIQQGSVVLDRVPNSGVPTFTINTGATLKGIGGIGFTTLNAGGHLDPGLDTPGMLSAHSLLTIAAGAFLDFGLGSATADEIVFDHLAPQKSGSGSILVNIFDSGGLTAGQTYTLLDWSLVGSSSLTPSDFALAASPVSGSFAISGNKLIFNTVPEPSFTVLLLLVGGVLAIARPKCKEAARIPR